MNLTFRPAHPQDEAFLYDLHRATMRDYVEKTWGGWDEDWQRAYFHRHYQPQQWRVVQLDEKDIGLLFVEERTEELFVGKLQIAPAYQGRGIGSVILRHVMAQAAASRKPVALKVLKVDHRALALYQRLGFGISGESDTHYIMVFEG